MITRWQHLNRMLLKYLFWFFVNIRMRTGGVSMFLLVVSTHVQNLNA